MCFNDTIRYDCCIVCMQKSPFNNVQGEPKKFAMLQKSIILAKIVLHF